MGKFKVSKADREKPSESTNGNVGSLVTQRADIPKNNFNPTKPLTVPFAGTNGKTACDSKFNATLSALRSKKTHTSTTLTDGSDEPLLDYEDYFKEEENGPARRKSAKKKKEKGGKKPTPEAPKSLSLAEQIGKEISKIRSYMSWRKPRDLREESRQNVLDSRVRNREQILYSRRCGARSNDATKVESASQVPVGENDPAIFELIWRFQRITFVEANPTEPWRLSRDRKRVAPPVDRVPHYNVLDRKRRKY